MDSAEKKQVKNVKNEDIFPNITSSSRQMPALVMGQGAYGRGIPRSFLANQIENGKVGNYAIRPQENAPIKQTTPVKMIPSLTPSRTALKQLTAVTPEPKTPQPSFAVNQPIFTPNNPVYTPSNPAYTINQPIFIPNQVTFVPNQANFIPNQPNFMPPDPNFMQNPSPNYMPSQSNFMPNPVFEPNYVNPASFDSQLNPSSGPISVNTNMYGQNEPTQEKQAYSPSDAYVDGSHEERQDQELREGSESPDFLTTGQKRLSAFKRLGPLTESKKPKLTINLTLNKNEAVREVVDDTKQESPKETYTPFHLRPNVMTSTDDTVMKYLVHWPWKKKFSARKRVTARNSKTVMMLELEQMEELYRKDTSYFEIQITGYPKSWKKEQVLDVLLEALKGKNIIPCFIYFTETECKFLVIRNMLALTAIHKLNFAIKGPNYNLSLTISDLGLNLNHLDFLPRLILSKRITMDYDNDRQLSLKAFTLGEDVSHFIYFPLHRQTNQAELVRIQSIVAWDYLTHLNLSHNKLSTIDGFDLSRVCPQLKHLDVSFNCIEKITTILKIRSLPLKSIKLEGNPICHNYIESELYVKVLRMIFSSLTEIDGIKIQMQGELPTFERNYCPGECSQIVSKFLETFFPLMDSSIEDRPLIANMYDEDATLTITYKYKLRYLSVFRYFRNIFLRSRVIDEKELDSVKGHTNISKHFCKWPLTKHDPYSFTVDVLWYNETSLILRISGIIKLTAESLADDEEILSFTRTFVLRTNNNTVYKIHNEMIYWEEPTEDCAKNAFKITTLKSKRLSLKLETPPDDDLKEKLTTVFTELTSLPKIHSARCLELKNWNFKNALQLFYKLLQGDNLDYLLDDH